MKKYSYYAVEFKKDRNILTTVVEKVDNTTGEVMGRTSYIKDINKDEPTYNWYRVLKNGTISEKISYMPVDLQITSNIGNYSVEFLADIADVFWSKYNRFTTPQMRENMMLYIDILIANESTSYGMSMTTVCDAIDTLQLTKNNITQYFMELVALRKEYDNSYRYREGIWADTQRRKNKVICDNLHITEDELQMIQDDRYWNFSLYSDYLIKNTNATILYLKLYNAYRTIMPCNYLLSLVSNAIKKASEKKIEYKVKGNPMDIIKNIADMYASLSGHSEELAEVNQMFKENQTSIPLDFEDENFIIKVPTTYGELLAEGSALKNCLGHYEFNNYVKNGRRRIAFIRQKSNPDKAYVACDIDVYKNEIIQFLRYGNEDVRDRKTLAFKEKYQAYLLGLEVKSNTKTTDYTDDDLAEKKFNQW